MWEGVNRAVRVWLRVTGRLTKRPGNCRYPCRRKPISRPVMSSCCHLRHASQLPTDFNHLRFSSKVLKFNQIYVSLVLYKTKLKFTWRIVILIFQSSIILGQGVPNIVASCSVQMSQRKNFVWNEIAYFDPKESSYSNLKCASQGVDRWGVLYIIF